MVMCKGKAILGAPEIQNYYSRAVNFCFSFGKKFLVFLMY